MSACSHLHTAQARNLISSKVKSQPRATAELNDADRRGLESEHRKRMLEIVQKTCLSMLKQIMAHKV